MLKGRKRNRQKSNNDNQGGLLQKLGVDECHGRCRINS